MKLCLCESLDNLSDELMADRVRIWQLPEALRALYFIGEHYGYETGLAVAYKRLEALESECDRLHDLATRGKQPKPLITSSPSFAELCRIRGQHDLAEQVEADWQLLLTDRDTSRLELIEQRRQETPQSPPLKTHKES